MNKAVVWQSWVSRDFKTRDGKPSIRRVLESKCGTVETCTNELIKDDLKHPLKRCSFFEHFNTQMYQQKMYKICRSLCEEGVCIMVQDFSRNRDVFYQFEIKSSYWTRKQITMHPTVIHLFGDGKWHRIVITHLSDITKHDAHFVHYITKDCIEYLTNHYPEIKLQKVIIWSDGCASQYKGKISFFYLNQLQAIFPSLEIQRNYYGSEHGKGESDAETGIFSKQIMDAVKSEKMFSVMQVKCVIFYVKTIKIIAFLNMLQRMI